jgi:hypothetical protein
LIVQVAAITMVGHYLVGNFHITSGAGGTVAITDPTVPNGGSVEPGVADIATGAQTTLAYSENSNAPSLGATEGRFAAIALLGNYMAGSFVAAGDGHGGTLVTQAQPQQQPLLTHPQACGRDSQDGRRCPSQANVLRCARSRSKVLVGCVQTD